MKTSTKHPDMRKRPLTAVCAAAALLGAIPATAEAKKPAKPPAPKVAKFRATLTGSQVTTWEYHRPDDKNNPCDASADGNGDQTIKFDAGGHFDLTFYKPTSKQPNLFGTHGRPAVTPLRIAVAGTADRHGEVAVHLDDIDRTKCDGPNGGGVDPSQVNPPTDCGARNGIIRTDFYYDGGPLDDGLYVPIPGGKPSPKDHLTLAGSDYDWRGNGQHGDNLDSAYKNCPLMLDGGYVEKSGHIFSSATRLPESKLFDKKRRKIVASGSIVSKRGGGQTTGQTIIAWNLRLTRVK
jgi:hypothetical protein